MSRHERLQPLQRIGTAEPARQQHRELQPDGRGRTEQIDQPLAKPRAARDVGHAEDSAQDDLEGDRLHAGVHRERPVNRPARDLAFGCLADDRLVGSACGRRETAAA